ncbi:hypothetical protein HDU98_008011 [Podochytrium sp. JEL0797]|nr:hypothetical protein HDU98_008011 [Podochytrium sp. JEL0797]
MPPTTLLTLSSCEASTVTGLNSVCPSTVPSGASARISGNGDSAGYWRHICRVCRSRRDKANAEAAHAKVADICHKNHSAKSSTHQWGVTPSSSSAAGASAMAVAAFKTPSKRASIAKPAATSPSTPLAVANHMYLRVLAQNVKSSEPLVLHDFWRFQIPGIGGDKYHLAILLRLVKGYQYQTEVAGHLFTYVMYPEDLNPTAVVNPNAKISDAETFIWYLVKT